MAKGSRKRKAEELEDEPRVNGANDDAKAQKQDSASADQSAALPAAEIVYRVKTAVAPPDTKNPDPRLFHGKAEIAHNFSTQYQVFGGDWAAMKNYKKISLPYQTFQINDIVYILREGNLPPVPDEDASQLEVLQFDRQVFAVGKIIDCHAANRHDVHVLIAYLYWPEELPGGRQPHHAEGELILSNHFEIIDPQSMSSISEIAHWNEWDDDPGAPVPERFWRQTFNVEHGRKGLSKLRSHCRCERPYNPDHKMYQCGHCKTWNHEQCLLEEVAATSYQHYKDDSLDTYADDHKPPESALERLKSGLVRTLENVGNAFRHEQNDSAKKSPKAGKKGKPKKNAHPWEAHLSIAPIDSDTDAAPAMRLKEKEGQQRHWDLTVDCLKCGKLLD